MRQQPRCSSRQLLRLSARVTCLVLFGHVLTSCILSDSRCDTHQYQTSAELHSCSCDPGYVLSPMGYGCIPCGDNEEDNNGKCVCKSGFARTSDSAPCEEVQGSARGASCDTSQPCNDPNPYCAVSESMPYCTTQGCSRNDDCPMDWRCGNADGTRFCQKPPQGFGDHCQSMADCSGKEAAFCETLMTHMCIVSDCVSHPSDCPSQSSCCDLTSLIGASLCVANSVLTDGKCPGGSTPVGP